MAPKSREIKPSTTVRVATLDYSGMAGLRFGALTAKVREAKTKRWLISGPRGVPLDAMPRTPSVRRDSPLVTKRFPPPAHAVEEIRN
jgi:hypothetical protein